MKKKSKYIKPEYFEIKYFKIFAVLLLQSFVCSALAQNNIFDGGIASGFAYNFFSQADPNPVLNNSIFTGGSASGSYFGCFEQQSSTTNINNTIFTGGSGTGYYLSCFAQNNPPQIPNNNVYLGGISSGSHFFCFAQDNPSPIPNNNIFAGGIASGFVWFTLGSFGNEVPLPITLLYLKANCNNNKVNIQWATLSEINTKLFLLEKSINALEWNEILRLNAAGFSNQLLEYNAFDELNENSKAYYRLKEYDFDGRYHVLGTVKAVCENQNSKFFLVSPNPTQGMVYFTNLTPGKTLKVYNVYGNLILSQNIVYPSLNLDLSVFESGIYLIIQEGVTTGQMEKIILNK